MKRSRMGIKRNRRRGTLLFVIIFCIVLPATAIYLGLKFTEKVMLPALNGEDEIPAGIELKENGINQETDNALNTNKKVETVEIKPFNIYTIQVASLNDTQNADKLISSLNSEKLSNLVYKIDNSYKVYTMAATNRSIIEENIGHIKEYYPDAYIAEIYVPSKKIQYDSNSQEVAMNTISQSINDLIDNMNLLSIEWNNLIQKRGEKGKYVELLKKQQSLLKELSDINNNATYPSSFQRKNSIEKMLEFQNENAIKALELLEASGEEVDFRIHSLYLDSLFRIVEVMK